ncbi:TetR family transcriptional regulator [uncultured Sporomusa sp.]|uniref:TetR family transcriptional regulator n=1 Tax=uncultured Sporomusa sp. TaxID=307249 RepID=A0A212LNI7_9FIRM|nr:TetR/AcrR family transcriptional regulator [uncultured Sporomusa sp.]SCM79105.1 TetR family transcriptional regulator [uncultured Sporomusa sp.]
MKYSSCTKKKSRPSNAKHLLFTTALEHFSRDGFEGASLGQIAADVGIKKPSIYKHFQSKEDLFIKVLLYTEHEVKRRIMQYFAKQFREKELKEILQDFPQFLLEEYEQELSFRFLLRQAFFPPRMLTPEVLEKITPLLDSFERLLTKRFRELGPEMIFTQPGAASLTYLTLIDGILAEMLYAGMNKAQRRIDAAWPVFCRGVFLTDSKVN